MRKIIQDNIPYALIFEDDPKFLSNFDKKLKVVAKEMKNLEKGCIISLENTALISPSFFQAKKHKYLYKASCGRMAGAYIIDNEEA